jgi:ferredoxin
MPDITIDRELCIGSGSCAYVAPEIFVLDEDGMPSVAATPEAVTPELLEAVQICPTGAIRVS